MTTGQVRICDMTFDLITAPLSRGHKGHFSKIASPPTVYVEWSCDSCIWLTLGPSTKLVVGKNIRDHLGSGGQIQRKHFKQRQWPNYRCQHVGLGQTCKSVHYCQTYGSGVKGQRGSIFKQCQMAKLTCQHVFHGQICKSLHSDLFV